MALLRRFWREEHCCSERCFNANPAACEKHQDTNNKKGLKIIAQAEGDLCYTFSDFYD